MSLCVAQVTPQGLFTGVILLLATTWPPQATKARWWRAPAVTIFLPLAQGKKKPKKPVEIRDRTSTVLGDAVQVTAIVKQL